MALNRVDYPANLTDQADFSAHGTLIETGYLDKSFAPLLVLGGEIPQGIVLQIGGVVYRADSAETVTGTASKYVRVAPSGATAAANYVANLSGVSWNAQYNGYYDGSGNLYIFDENQALYDGAVATVKTRFVQQTEEGDVYVRRDLYVDNEIDCSLLKNSLENPLLQEGGKVVGFYNGATSLQTLTDYPVGTLLPVRTINDFAQLGAVRSIRVNAPFEYGLGTTGSVLSGTWRCMGILSTLTDDFRQLFQRIS